MANNVSVEIKGLDELEKKLYDIPANLAKRYMRIALRAGAAVFLKEIERSAPRDTGFMASQATMTTRVSNRDQQGTANVGFRVKQNPARHLSTVGSRQRSHEEHVPSAANEARWYEMGTVKQPARPFMRPAFEAFWHAALDRFGEVLKAGLKELTD